MIDLLIVVLHQLRIIAAIYMTRTSLQTINHIDKRGTRIRVGADVLIGIRERDV